MVVAGSEAPHVVGLGGTVREGSASETALRTALRAAEDNGARVTCLTAADLDLPFYDPQATQRSAAARHLVAVLRDADGLIVCSPGYHGALSGLVKNALDYVEDTAADDRAYLTDLPVGCIGVAQGSQAAGAVLADLRSIAHALRAFPTPYGAAVIAGPGALADGQYSDPLVRQRLELVGRQVAEFARMTVRDRRHRLHAGS
jgi:FMN reductase